MLVSTVRMAGPQAGLVGYRFAGVELDVTRGLLRVDGAEVSIGALPFKLLRQLCEAQGALVTRQALFDHLWPRQTISDEALTKLIGRSREFLGNYRESLVTVRGQGLRLDAVIELLIAAPETVSPASQPASPVESPLDSLRGKIDSVPTASSPARRDRRPWLALAALALVLCALALWRLPMRPDEQPLSDAPVFSGFALQTDDIQASRPQTFELLRLADVAWGTGDLDRARSLLRSVHADDTASPAAGLVLSYIDESVEAGRWAREAQLRVTANTSPYMRLLLDYALLNATSRDASRASLDAVLAVRPQAHRLQLRRAHMDIANRDFDAALRRLEAIPLTGPPASVIFRALEGRAAFGATDPIRAALAQGVLADSPVERGLIEARLIWRSGDHESAIARLDAVARTAESLNSFTFAATARESAALYAYSIDRPDAAARIASATHKLRADQQLWNVAELDMLAAELAWEAGDQARARQLLEGVDREERSLRKRIALELLNLRLGAFPGHSYLTQDSFADPELSNGVAELIQAWNAHAQREPERARSLLAQSQAAGIAQTWFAEDSQLLGAMLGTPTPTCIVDLPYPNALRVSACRALGRLNRSSAVAGSGDNQK